MKQILRVIVESPLKGLTGSPEEYVRNRIYARRCARACLLEGMAPFASHLIYAQPGVLDDLIPEERGLGIGAGLAWSYLADLRIFFVDYGWSDGMLRAKKHYDEFSYPYKERMIGPNPREEEAALMRYHVALADHAPLLLEWLSSNDLDPEHVERGRQVRRLLDAVAESKLT